jgi:hypothetical protein
MVQIEKKGKPTWCPFLRYSRTRILPAVTPTASVSPISSATVTPFHWPSLVNRKGSPAEFSAVQRLDGLLGLFSGTHLHEPETPWPPTKFIHDHLGRFYGTVCREYFLQLAFGYGIWQTANVQFITHVLLL